MIRFVIHHATLDASIRVTARVVVLGNGSTRSVHHQRCVEISFLQLHRFAQFGFGDGGIPHDHNRIDRHLAPFLNFDHDVDAMIDLCVIAFDDGSFEAGIAIHRLNRPDILVKSFWAEETWIQKLSFSNLHACANLVGAEMLIAFNCYR